MIPQNRSRSQFLSNSSRTMTNASTGDLSYLNINVSYAYNEYKISVPCIWSSSLWLYIQESVNIESKEEERDVLHSGCAVNVSKWNGKDWLHTGTEYAQAMTHHYTNLMAEKTAHRVACPEGAQHRLFARILYWTAVSCRKYELHRNAPDSISSQD